MLRTEFLFQLPRLHLEYFGSLCESIVGAGERQTQDDWSIGRIYTLDNQQPADPFRQTWHGPKGDGLAPVDDEQVAPRIVRVLLGMPWRHWAAVEGADGIFRCSGET